MKENFFIWSDNWHMESGEAWFVDGRRDTLFHVDLKTNVCDAVAVLPNQNKSKFRLNSKCIKVAQELFCMPNTGRHIWVYDTVKQKFNNIKVDCSEGVRLSVLDFWKYGNKIFAVSIGLKKIIEIDIGKKSIDAYYAFPDHNEETLARSVRVGADIYCVSAVQNKIYQFNMDVKEMTVHTVPVPERGLRTIAFDGRMFWLSGYRKEIYVWDKCNGIVKSLKEFPNGFGIYNFAGKGKNMLDCISKEYDVPTFIQSMTVGRYVWFIPFCTNKIIYADQETYRLHALEIEDEEETEKTLARSSMKIKYTVQYVYGNRYIGLFSHKNNCVIEIDADKGTTEKKKYTFGLNSLEEVCKPSDGMFQEEDWIYRILFQRALFTGHSENGLDVPDGIGSQIYRRLVQ